MPRAACPVSMWWEGEYPLSMLCLSYPPQGTLCVKKQTRLGRGSLKGQGRRQHCEGFCHLSGRKWKRRFGGRESESDGASWLHPPCSGSSGKCEKPHTASHRLLRSSCVATARTVFLALIFGLTVNESSNSADAAASGANYTPPQPARSSPIPAAIKTLLCVTVCGRSM